MTVPIKVIGRKPEKQHKEDACFDCFSRWSFTLKAGERVAVPLGFALELPVDYEALVRPRSGLSKSGIDCILGTIDSNYRGEICAIMVNNTQEEKKFSIDDRICQLAIREVPEVDFIEKEELSETERSSNGFGSTGL